MSRIHEALRRAEQEKAAQLPVAERAHAARVAEEVAVPLASPISPNRLAEERIRAIPPSPAGGVLRFEELVKRCSHPEWKADSALRVSLAGESGKIVAERFRTLRSRLYQIGGMRPLRR